MNTVQNQSTVPNQNPNQTNLNPQSQNASPTKDIRELIFLGRIEETFEEFGFTWAVHTLNGKENSEAMAAVQHLDGLAQLNQLRIEVLSRAIGTINGQPLETLYQGSDPNASIATKRREVMGSLQSPVLNKLFDKYSAMVDRGNKSVEGSDLGK